MKKILLFAFLLCGTLTANVTFASEGKVCVYDTYPSPPLNAAGYVDGESVTYDQNSGDYIIKYFGDSGKCDGPDRIITLVYDTPNKIKPNIKVQMRTGLERDVVYGYDVSNEKTAKQPIYSFSFTARTGWFENSSLISNATVNSQIAAGNLAGAAQTLEGKLTYVGSVEDTRMTQSYLWLPEFVFAKSNQAFRVRWQAHPNKPVFDDIKPGHHKKGFQLAVPYLPGYAKVHFLGNSKSFAFPGSAPGGKIMEDIDAVMFGGKAPAPSVGSLVPKILIPEPYSTKVLATGINNDLASWVEAGQLSENLAQKLRLSFAAIGDAAERNNSSGVNGNAERVFHDLFSRHEGMNHRNIEGDEDEGKESAKKHANHPELSHLAARAIAFNTFQLVKRFHSSKK